MNRLVSVVGPAPSELSFDQFCMRLITERERVRVSLAEFRERKHLKPARAQSAKTKQTNINKMLKNLPADELVQFMEFLKQKEQQKNGN